MATAPPGFLVGQRVIFYVQAGGQWFEGKIERTAVGPSGNDYLIQKFEPWCESVTLESPLNKPGESLSVPTQQIRPLPEESQTMDRWIMATMMAPTFQDPYAHLYMDDDDDDDLKMRDEHKIITPDGRTISTRLLTVPAEEELLGIVQHEDLFRLINHVPNRRKLPSGRRTVRPTMNTRKVLASVLPRREDVPRLSELAQVDPSKMLQWGDALNFGLYGIRRDVKRAVTVYVCAAWGVSEENYRTHAPFDPAFAYPMGPPEALCAAASAMWTKLESLYVWNDAGPTDYRFHLIISDIARDPDSGRMSLLGIIVVFIGHALRREWVCPFALAFGQALRQNQMLDPFLPHSMHIISALELEKAREEEVSPQVMQAMGLPEGVPLPPGFAQHFAAPSEEQLNQFQPKATQIFMQLPARAMNPSGICRSDYHIEYREMPFPPFPTILFSFNPQSNYVHNPPQLPDNLMYTPYSREAFDYLWGRLVFHMHMGDKTGNSRFRPALITFANRPGDRQFAQYVQEKIGPNSGTEVRIVQPESYMVQVGRCSRRLSHIVAEVESSLVSGMKGMIQYRESDMMTPLERANTLFHNRVEIPIEDLLEETLRLKEEGNELFGNQRWLAAQKCYTQAVDKIRVSIHTDDRVHRLLGTLLSNRAQCFIQMAEGMSIEPARDTLKKAILDCEIVLNSQWRNAVPASIQTKLRRRKAVAEERRTRLSSLRSGSELYAEYSGGAGAHAPNASAPDAVADTSAPDVRAPAPAPSRQNRNRGNRRRNESQRQRRNRRRRERNANRAGRQTHETEQPDNEPEDEDEQQPASTSTFLMGKEVLESSKAPFVNGKEDPCPCCFDRFRVELSETMVVVNECGHGCCVKCLAVLWDKSQCRRATVAFTCPICRVPLPDDVLSESVDHIILKTDALKGCLGDLPLSDVERTDVAKKLLFQHKFVTERVLQTLDSMLVDNLQASLRRSEALSPKEKQQIYEEARRPVDALHAELAGVLRRRATIRDQEGEAFIEAQNRIDELRMTLIPAARENAKAYIFERINSAGRMGGENETGDIEVDFHALHIDEAKEQFDEQVLPVLQAVRSVIIVVGRGNHSEGGAAKLKPALKKHIEKHAQRRNLRYTAVPGNDGVIRVEWWKT